MDLRTYISETMYDVLRGIHDADDRLRKEGLGRIWTGDFHTHSQALINARIAKGVDPSDPEAGRSLPVLILDYDVNVTAQDEKKSGDLAEVGAKASALHIFSFQGGVKAQSEKALLEKSVQNLKFSVPVAIDPPKR